MTLALRVLLAVVLMSPFESLDAWTQRATQSTRSPRGDRVAHAATDVGKPATVLGALLAIALFTGPAGPPTARYALAVLLPVNVTVEVTKRVTDRTRPDGRHTPSNASFPSSHAANAFALAAVFSRRWPRGALLFWFAAGVVAWSRIYLNRHFLSDVLFAGAIGVGFAWLVAGWFRSRGWLAST